MDPKPGIQTSEFWSTMFMHLITLATLFGVNINSDKLSSLIPVAAMIASGVAQAFYSHSRGHLKSASLAAASSVVAAKAYAAAPADVPVGGPVADPLGGV